ncbi:MAG: ATP synthase F1 subunit gamma [Chloracidobacterium sp.]|uniref:ATP synthase gamma chain n=1 Tax=Chloracidobacterium validum TaxID=2821543 RepID=A0ABX8B7T5_9BACT|nr:ATP synthase F1 subunit gamma [Chloracidobacterium validum]QUW02121.1 ATP synthase F1 subunit gamma [Chloracidobacterium validum]
MPNLQGVRRRIKAVKNMRQITKSYKLVSASKLRRAQERVTATRPYARKIREVLHNLSATVTDFTSPLMEERTGNRTLLVLMTADKGLCGAFNANLIRSVQQYIADHPSERIELITVGRKGRDFFRRRTVPIRKEYINVTAKTFGYDVAVSIAQDIMDIYEGVATEEDVLAARPDRVLLVYAEFRSAISQVVRIEPLLPVGKPAAGPSDAADAPAAGPDYIYEQPPAEILGRLLPRFVETCIFQALLESVASEHGARMAAMDSASRNAGEVIANLTLTMNRIRQAAITNEIIEVVSGAAAL